MFALFSALHLELRLKASKRMADKVSDEKSDEVISKKEYEVFNEKDDDLGEEISQGDVEEGIKIPLLSRKKQGIIIFKILLFSACLAGFSYQASEFLHFYWTYPTVVDLKVKRVGDYVAPAFTFCLVTKVTNTTFCEKHPEFCRIPEKTDPVCSEFPSYCERDNMQVPEFSEYKKLPLIDINDLIDRENDNFAILSANPWLWVNETVGPYYYVSWWTFKVMTCYTLNSRAETPKDPIRVDVDFKGYTNDKNQRYFIGYMVFNLMHINNLENVEGVALAVHSPFYTTVPSVDKLLKPGHQYDLEILVEEEVQLEAPYGTACIDYIEIWENNNRTGPRAERMCNELCELDYHMGCYGCVTIWNIYPHSERRCFHGTTNKTENCDSVHKPLFDACNSRCKMECSKTEYKATITDKKKDVWNYLGYYDDTIHINVYTGRDILRYTHRPQFQFVELFSYFGYMGIWLGISLFALADILKSCIIMLRPFLQKLKMKHSKRLEKEMAKRKELPE